MVLNSNTLDFLWLQDGEQGTPGSDGSSLYTWVKYSQNANGSNMTDDSTDALYIGIAYNKTSATESNNASDYSWTLIKGDDGEAGEDAYTIILTNENISFSTTKTNVPLTNQSATCGIVVYKGTDPVTNFSIGTVTSPTGITTTKTANSVTASVSTSTAVTNNNGTISVPITIGSITVTKYIAYSLSKQGDDGRGIVSTTVDYQAASDGVNVPTGTWLPAIPTVSPSEFLWTRTTITYTSGNPSYSYSVSKNGKGIASATVQYRISSTNTSADSGRSDGSVSNWSGTRPTDVQTDEYLWIRYEYTYDDGSSPTYSNPIYDSTIDGISSILDTEHRTIKDTVWETAYFTVVDEDTGDVVQMNIKNTIVENTTDISGIESRVSSTETNLGDFKNSDYTVWKQSVDQFQSEVTDNVTTATTIATQTAEDFSWLFSKNIYDAYLIDDNGNFIIDSDNEFFKAEKDSLDDVAKISFTREGIDLVNGIIEVKAPDGETTIIEGGRINVNRIASVDGNSWINLGLGTFNYGNKLTWDGLELRIEGNINATTGYIGGVNGWRIDANRLYNGSFIGEASSMYLGTVGLGYADIAGYSNTDWRFTIGSYFGVTSSGLYIGSTDSHVWFDDGDIDIRTGGNSLVSNVANMSDRINGIDGRTETLEEQMTSALSNNNAIAGLAQIKDQFLDFNTNDGLTIGDKSQSVASVFATRINNNGIYFLKNGISIAYITGNEFNIQNGVIQNGGFLRIGNFVFAPDGDGSFGLRYSPIQQNQNQGGGS